VLPTGKPSMKTSNDSGSTSTRGLAWLWGMLEVTAFDRIVGLPLACFQLGD
jgi:hypothetical protein